jgi:hypothetical protein
VASIVSLAGYVSHSPNRDIRRVVRRGAQALIGLIALAGNAAAQDYPRLANLYLHGSVDPRVIPDLARWDLLVLNAVWSQNDLDRLRRLNPDIKIFLYVCPYCVELDHRLDSWGQQNLDYAARNDLWWYNRNVTIASDWPGSRMVNITPQAPVAPNGSWREYIAARIALLMQLRPAADGVFLDNYWRSISWNQGVLQLDSDCNPTHNPAGCDGVMDDNTTLDAMWNQALRDLAADLRARFDVLEAGRARPLALFSNSATDYHKWLNGTLWEFFPEGRGRKDPGNVHGYNWLEPMLAQSTGYLQAPFSSDPYRALVVNSVVDGTPSGPRRTADSERHMRFTLVSALLGDGYYSLDAGLALGHGQLWWEPEYDEAGRGTGYLGQPTGAAYRVVLPSGPEQVINGDFSRGYIGWRKLNEGAATGNLTIDSHTFHSAPASARIDVQSVNPGNLKVWQSSLALRAGKPYTLRFWARSTKPQKLLVHLYSNACKNSRCMQDTYVEVGLGWQEYTMSFVSPNDAVAGLNMFVSQVSSVWVDDLSLRQGDSNVFRRDFENGTVLLNYASTTQTVDLGKMYRRLAIPGSTVFDGHIVRGEAVGPSDAQILLLVGDDPTDAPPGGGGGRLYQNEPNPFNPNTRIRFSLQRTSRVALTIHSVAGQRVRTLIDGLMPGSTEHVVIWDGDDDLHQPVASGVYFYKLQTPAYSDMRKMTLVR